MSRAENRHHAERVKSNRRKHVVCWKPTDPRVVGKLAQTPRPCACWACRRERYARPPKSQVLAEAT